MVQSATGLSQGTHSSSQRNTDGPQCLGLLGKGQQRGSWPPNLRSREASGAWSSLSPGAQRPCRVQAVGQQRRGTKVPGHLLGMAGGAARSCSLEAFPAGHPVPPCLPGLVGVLTTPKAELARTLCSQVPSPAMTPGMALEDSPHGQGCAPVGEAASLCSPDAGSPTKDKTEVLNTWDHHPPELRPGTTWAGSQLDPLSKAAHTWPGSDFTQAGPGEW